MTVPCFQSSPFSQVGNTRRFRKGMEWWSHIVPVSSCFFSCSIFFGFVPALMPGWWSMSVAESIRAHEWQTRGTPLPFQVAYVQHKAVGDLPRLGPQEVLRFKMHGIRSCNFLVAIFWYPLMTPTCNPSSAGLPHGWFFGVKVDVKRKTWKTGCLKLVKKHGLIWSLSTFFNHIPICQVHL